MLVLSRKCGEEIVVPESQLVLRVLDVRGGKVRLGISAPNGSKVYRREVWTRMQLEAQGLTPGTTSGAAVFVAEAAG